MNKTKSKKQATKQRAELKVLLTFLKRTKAGKYAPVDRSSLPYSRLNEQPEVGNEELYLYGLT